jgi:hypothetical protein
LFLLTEDLGGRSRLSAKGQHSPSGSPNGALGRVWYKSSVPTHPSLHAVMAAPVRDFGTDLLVAKVQGQPQAISNIEGEVQRTPQHSALRLMHHKASAKLFAIPLVQT